MPYRDNLSAEQAIRIFQAEGAHWQDQGDDFSSYFVSNKTGEHLGAVWDSSAFWTYRIGGQNGSAHSMKSAKRFVERYFNDL